MPLFRTTIERVTGRGHHLFGIVGEKMFNTDGIFHLAVNDSTKSSFVYAINLEDDRDGIVRVESTDSVSTIAAWVDVTNQNNFVTLSVYPEGNTSGTVETTSIALNKIVLAYDFDSGAIIYVKYGALLERILVSQSIAEIFVLTGATTTTTTTSTSTTSTSSTSTSSTSSTSTSTSSTSTTTVTEGDFRVTSGETTSATNIRLQTTEVPYNPTLIYTEFSATQLGNALTVSAISSGDSYIDLTVLGIAGGSDILVTYGGTTAESTFGTELDLFTNLVVTNNIALPAYVYWDDGVDYFRLRTVGNTLYLDQGLTATRWAGVEDVDWVNVWEKILPSMVTTTTTSTTTEETFTIVSASVETGFERAVRVVFSDSLNTDAPDPSEWTIKVNGVPIVCSGTGYVADTIERVSYSVGDPQMQAGDVITVTYSGNTWESLPDGIPLEQYTDYPVTNNL